MADEQLNEIEARDAALYGDLLDLCEDILDSPAAYQALSAAIQTNEGIVMRTALPGRHPYRVFWATDSPEIRAVFPWRG